MALPVAHSMVGLALAIWRFFPICCSLKGAIKVAWQRRLELLICIIIANAPDIDLAIGMLVGKINLFHHLVTHTLGWILLAALCLWLYLKFAVRRPPGFALWFVFLLMASHLLIDIFTADTRKPIGIMLAWPFSESYWHAACSIFPAPAKKTLADVPSLHNLRNAAVEFLICLPLLALALVSKIRKRVPPSAIGQ